MKHGTLFTLALAACSPAFGQMYMTEVIIRDLSRPTGIAVNGNRSHGTLFLTQLPTPGVPGSMGGKNTVDAYDLRRQRLTNLTTGEPEPTNLALGCNSLYWTCKSANVILERSFRSGKVEPFLTGLAKPSGISVGEVGEVYFTQVPTPGVPGGMGGKNTVDVSILGRVFNLTDGEPEPTDIVAGNDGNVYWTCKSANVILSRNKLGMVSLLDNTVEKPSGIAIDRTGRFLFWTEVPTPGVGGGNGGRNKVVRYDLMTKSKLNVNVGDPEPTDVAVGRDGTVYWTCTSAGVVVRARLAD